MPEFDFIKAFTGIDILAVDACAKIVAHAEVVMFNEMIDAGLSPDDAHRIIRTTIEAIATALASVVNRGKGAR